MYLARVVGNVVSTKKDERLVGFKLLLVRRIDDHGRPISDSEVAVDTVGAGSGETVIVTRGSSARYAAHPEQTPLDASIVGIVDTIEVEEN